ncbi:hypothetical protein MNBD_ALPHA09-1815 [hydrothermal vent metagenome]|uniref:Peptidoglycan binding-like domain-containing protein n=1 Tax=hydrothermal vent metagenome TaxID=652676 RepID=A0A3B0TKR6_9ZZZZ
MKAIKTKVVTTLFGAAAAMAMVSFATPSQAQFCVGNAIECGLLGAGAGGGLGAALGGRKGARTGAAIGGVIGVLQGAENRRRQQAAPAYVRPHRRAPVRTYRPRPRAISTQLTADIQYSLTNLGYNPGPVDGVMGRNTRRAVKEYQQDNGLLMDGRISNALRQHLRANGG